MAQQKFSMISKQCPRSKSKKIQFSLSFTTQPPYNNFQPLTLCLPCLYAMCSRIPVARKHQVSNRCQVSATADDYTGPSNVYCANAFINFMLYSPPLKNLHATGLMTDNTMMSLHMKQGEQSESSMHMESFATCPVPIRDVVPEIFGILSQV